MIDSKTLDNNLMVSSKLIQFALKTKLSDVQKVVVDYDPDYDFDGEMANLHLFITLYFNGDGMYEPNDICYELERLRDAIWDLFNSSGITMDRMGKITQTKDKPDIMGPSILKVNIDHDDFKVGYAILLTW